MIIILDKNDKNANGGFSFSEKMLQRASLVVVRRPKTFKVIKSRYSARKVLRINEILN